MKAQVTLSKYNCIYSLRYLNKEIEVVKCTRIKGLYKLVNGDCLFHKDELIFE